MKKKINVYSELLYVLGLVVTAIGVILTEKAAFGMSMIVAPSYILHLKLSEHFNFFSFGVSQYVFQGLIILLTMLAVRRFRATYFFTFCTVVLYGSILDLVKTVFSCFNADLIWIRIICFIAGTVITTLGVSFMIKTYLSPESYELFVKEVSKKYNFEIGRVKFIFDLSFFALSIIMSFAFFGFGKFQGIGIGTVVCAFVNGILISTYLRLFDKHFQTVDLFKLRRFFE